MIVPGSRLLWWVGVGVVPFAALAGLVPEVSMLCLAIILGVAGLAGLDAVLGQSSLEGIDVELPAVVRLSKDRAGAIELRIRNERRAARRLRLGLPLPAAFRSEEDEVWTTLPHGSEFARLRWACTPRQRGLYSLNACYLEAASPWGFWAVRARRPVESEVRVYPNLFTERKGVAALFLHRGGFGVHALRQVGKGRDFEKLREYLPGDSYEDVHWKATAKRGRPVTKVFQIERTQEVYVVIDASRLSARPLKGREARDEGRGVDSDDRRSTPDPQPSTSVLERFITAALVLGLAAEQQGDLFGLVTFSDRIQTFVRARNGRAHYGACRDAIYTLQPQTVTPDFDELGAFIRLRLRRRALLVFLTSLDDPVLAESFTRNLDLIGRQHLILVNMIQPPGAQRVFSDPDAGSLDELYRNLGGHVLWHNLRELGRTLERRGVRFSLLEDERLSAGLVSRYLDVKRRQLL
jgi:uncharacterized protein (DUF58 family)